MRPRRIDAEAGIVFGFHGKPLIKKASGYVVVRQNGRHFSIHRMIWESVNGPIPDGLQINHINGIRSDNRISNLELVTPGGNTAHAYKLGLSRADGENNGRAKLSVRDVITIRSAVGFTHVQLARQFGVSREAIRDIRCHKNWRSIV